jgi:hypothetical protein
MSRKTDIKSRMNELQKEFSELNLELKEIDSIEKSAQLCERYKGYLFKVFVTGRLTDDPKWEDVTDADREVATEGQKLGLIYSGNFNEGAWLLFKNKEEYPRVRTLIDRLYAFEALSEKNCSDRESQIKIILGEA